MKRCKICGRFFRLKSENRYEVLDRKLIPALESLIKKPIMFTVFEAFDCPWCGCQNVVGVREPRFDEVTTNDSAGIF